MREAINLFLRNNRDAVVISGVLLLIIATVLLTPFNTLRNERLLNDEIAYIDGCFFWSEHGNIAQIELSPQDFAELLTALQNITLTKQKRSSSIQVDNSGNLYTLYLYGNSMSEDIEFGPYVFNETGMMLYDGILYSVSHRETLISTFHDLINSQI